MLLKTTTATTAFLIDCLIIIINNIFFSKRFQNTIVNHFFGHSHRDEYELYFDEENGNKPIGVGYLAPSMTTYTNLNPGYRVYHIDGDRVNSTWVS